MLDRTVRIAGILCLITFCSVCQPQFNEIGISFMTGKISVEEDVETVQVRLMANGKYETPFTVGVTCFEKFPVEARVGTVNKSTIDVYPQQYTVEFNDVGKNSSMSTPLTINIVDDPHSETSESFICIVFQPRDVPAVQLRNPRSLEISIVDNDKIFVRFNSSNFEIDEDAGSLDVYFEVVREVSPGVYVPAEYTLDFQILVRTVSGTATDNSDFEMKEELVTFSAGQQFSTPFSVMIIDDTLCEGPEQFNVSYSINSSSVKSGANVRQLDTTATVVILDNDVISISFEREEYFAVEGISNVLQVRLNISGEIQNRFTVDILPCSKLELNRPSSKIGPGDNNATSGADFSGAVISVTFWPGMMQSSIAVFSIVNDNFLEGPEKFELCFQPTDDYKRKSINRGDPKLAMVTIIDDPHDIPFISLKRFMVTAREGSDDVVDLTVRSVPLVSFPFHVFIKLNNKTATSGTDFVGDRIRVDFAPFQESVVVSIPLIDDNTAEEREWFTAKLEVPPEFTNKSITAGGIVRTRVTVVDDDCVTITMAMKSNIPEGGDLLINVSVLGNFQYSFSVSVVATNGSATGGVDFDNNILSVHFEPNGASVQEIKLRIIDDKLNEGDEKFMIHLQRQTGNNPCYKIGNGNRNVTIIDDDAISIFFEQERYSVVEGKKLSVRLNISGEIQNPFTVDILPCSELELNWPSSKIGPGDNNATSGADFSGAVVPVTFQPGMMLSSIAVINIVNDNSLEGPENFELCFQLTADHKNRRISQGDPELAMVTITDNQPDGVCVSMSAHSYSADEDDGEIVVTIETDKQSFVIPFDVILMISDKFVSNDGDVPTLQYTVTIPAGEASVDYLIEVNSDYVLEGDETFVIMLQPTGAASDVLVSTCPQRGEANITIVNDDMEIEFTAPEVTVVERGGPAEFCVERRGDIRSEVNITVSTDNITDGRPRAEAYLDYIPLEDVVATFPAGVASVCFNVTVTDDDALERPTSECDDPNLLEYASISITSASTPQATGWNSSTAELVIEDDDVEFEFSLAQCSSVLSDNSRRIYTCVKLCGYRGAPAEVIVTLQTSEGDPVGVEGISTRLYFTANSTQQCANLTLVDDDRIETLETFNLDLEPVVSGNRTHHQRTRAIQCPVTSEFVLISFETSAMVVKENTEHLQLRLKSRGRISKPFQVSFACIEVHPVEAKEKEDFTGGVYAVSFTNTSSDSLTSVSSVADIAIVDDGVSESTESFFCVLLRQSRTSDDGVVAEDPDTISVAIEDNDLLRVRFSNASYSGEEGDSVEIRLLASPFERPFQIQIILIDLDQERNQSDIRVEATTGVDYTNYTLTAGEGAVQFDPSYGPLSTPLVIPLFSDNIAEGTEYFGLSFVQIITDGDNPILITPVDPVQAIVAINDTSEILVRFNSSNFEIDEDASSLDVYFEVVRGLSHGVYIPAEYTFDFQVLVRTVNGTANGSDFEEKVNSVIFEAGQQFSTPFSVKITDDNISEGSEQFTVSYSIISSSVRSGAIVRQLDTTATVVINDNDAVAVNLQTRRLTVTEGDNDTVNLTVQANVSVSFQFHVFVVLINKTANGGTDFVGDRIRVDFTPFQTSVDISIPLIDDNTAEEREWFTAKLEVPPEFTSKSIIAGGIVTTRVIINDDDCVIVTMEAYMNTVSENDTLLLIVMVDNDFDAGFTVSIASFNGSATSGADFNGRLVSVGFDPDDSRAQWGNIMIYDDKLNEEDETFTVQLERPIGNNLCYVIENGTLDVIIRDENVLTVGIERNSVTVKEGVNGSVNITIVGDIQASFPFHVFLCPVNGTAESGTDFVGDRIRVDFAPFQTSVDVSIPLINDNTAEKMESFTVKLVVPPEFTNKKITAGDIVRTRVTVYDDDCVNVTVATNQTVQEADILVLTISARGDFDVGFNITVATKNGSAEGGVDFNNSVLFVHFDPNGANDHEIRIEIFADDDNEGDEIFSIQLQRISEDSVCYQFGNNGIMDVLIDDNTPDPVKVGLVQNQRILSHEGERISLNIYRIGAISKNLSIEIQVESNSARIDSDYHLLQDFVVFSKLKETLEIIELTVIKLLVDGESEEEESLVVTLANTPGVIYIQQSVVVTISRNKT